MKSKIFFLAIILIPFFFSCKDSPCDLKTNSVLQVGFYTLISKTAILSPDTLTAIYGIGEEGKLLYKDTAFSTVFFPLSQNHDTSSFVINSKGTVDTLTLIYTRQLKLISKECGFAILFTIGTVKSSKNKFDSISIINPAINTTYAENIRIFF